MITQQRISVWSGPRNVSTALMYSFAQREDTRVLDEPLYGHYLKVSGAQHPGRDQVMAHMELQGTVVVEELLSKDYQKPLLFIKNMAHHLTELDYKFLRELTNVLLIRDPREMLPSLVKQIPHPNMLDTALQMLWELYEYLLDKGQHPLILDSKELLLDPPKILTELCEQLQIPYSPKMLQWSPGARPEDGIWAPHWYHQVHQSSGFAAYQPKNESVRDDLQELLEQCIHFYQLLYDKALKA